MGTGGRPARTARPPDERHGCAHRGYGAGPWPHRCDAEYDGLPGVPLLSPSSERCRASLASGSASGSGATDRLCQRCSSCFLLCSSYGSRSNSRRGQTHVRIRLHERSSSSGARMPTATGNSTTPMRSCRARWPAAPRSGNARMHGATYARSTIHTSLRAVPSIHDSHRACAGALRARFLAAANCEQVAPACGTVGVARRLSACHLGHCALLRSSRPMSATLAKSANRGAGQSAASAFSC